MVDSLGHRQSNPATARLLDRDGLPIGAGFVVGPNTIATCAHVVAVLADTDPESPAAPTISITLDFPLATDSSEKTATVTAWQPIRPDGSGDIALLELDEPIDIPIPPLWRLDAPWGRRFRVLGFPDGQPDGVWSCGEFRAPQGTGWIQMHGSAAETRIEAGFSGSPVWDDASGAIIGMTVAADARPGSSTGFLIPIDQVLGVDPRLLPNPYRGLESFGENDSALFFGRDDEIERLVAASGRSRLVAVTGHSGAGKSSLVRAGLLPVLRARGVRIVEYRPTAHTSWSLGLAAALAGLLLGDVGVDQQWRWARQYAENLRDPAALRAVAAEIAFHTDGAGCLLFIDQFEELAIEDGNAARELFGWLVDLIAADPDGPLRAVVTLRAESVADLLTADTAEIFDHSTVHVAAMSSRQLRAVIEGPTAHAPGLHFEPGLVERIVDDAGPDEPGRLPLVETLLTQLWEQREHGHLTSAAYERIGGVSGAVRRVAERAIVDSEGPSDDGRLRVLFTSLARPSGDGFVRRIAAVPADPRSRRLAYRLAERRIVVISDGPDGAPMMELAHQALIDQWPRLQEWLADDREFLAWRDRLDHQQNRWQHSGRNRGVLPRGTDLVEARRWQSRRGAELVPAQHDFIRAAKRYRDRRLAGLVGAVVLVIVATVAATITAIGWQDGQPAAGGGDVAGSVSLTATLSDPGGSSTSETGSAGGSESATGSSGPADPTTPQDSGPTPFELPEATDVPQAVKDSCTTEQTICVWSEPDFSGTHDNVHMDNATGSTCREFPFPVQSFYINTTESQYAYTDSHCGGDFALFEAGQAGYSPVYVLSYKHD